VVIESGIVANYFSHTDLVYGTVYTFQIQARSEYEDLSLYSNAVSILAAQEPAQPEPPISTVEGPNDHGPNVIFTWVAPDDMGSPITAYRLEIRKSDGVTFAEDLTHCDGSREPIPSALQCSVPINTLRTDPYNLPWGSSIWAKVIAINLYAESLESFEGNGAVILTYPDPPINLVEDWTHKSDTQIGLVWEDSAFNGGAEFLDYRINYDQGIGEYVILESNVVDKVYLAINLTPAVTYSFKVEVRNRWDYSTYSNELIVLCAYKPHSPIEPTTKVVASNVVIEWVAPFNGGSPILGYRILIREIDLDFSEQLDHCDGSLYTIFTTTACTVPLSILYAEPYNLPQGEGVYVKVIPYNVYGDSEEPSPLGNGAIIVFVPDAPFDLSNVPSVTNAFQIGLTWTEGLNDGGEDVVFYKIIYD
jgi:hypothetical protein